MSRFDDGLPEILLTVDIDSLPEVPVFTSSAAANFEDSRAAVNLVQSLLRLAESGVQAGELGDGETLQLRGAQVVAVIRGLDEWQRGFALMAALDALSGLWHVVSHSRSAAEIAEMAAAAGYQPPK